MTATPRQLAILLHALGLQHAGDAPYRRHFVTGPGSTDHADCLQLTAAGLLEQHPASALTGGDDLFIVTPSGRQLAIAAAPPAPRLTRGQRRYRDWLAADTGQPFGQWLRRA